MVRTGMLFFFIIQMLSSSGQTSDTVGRQSVSDTRINSLLFSFDFANNSNVFGDVSYDIRQPSYSPSVAMLSKWGADFLMSGNFTDNSDDSLERFSSELDLMIGYNLKPHKNLSIYPSYTYYFYSANASSFKSMFNSDIRLDADYSYKFFSAGLSAGYMTGEQHTFYAAFRNYYQIKFDRFLSRNVALYFQPEVDVNFGTYEYLNRFYLDQLRENRFFYSYLLKGSPELRLYVLREKIKHPELSKTEIIDRLLEEQTEDSFKLTSVNLSASFMVIVGNAGFNLGVYAMMPANQPGYLIDEVMVYFNAGITWSLDVGK